MKLPPVQFAKRQIHARPLFVFAMAFLAGLILGNARPVALPFLLGLLAAFACISGLLFARKKTFVPLWLIIALILGMVRMEISPLPTSIQEDRYSVNMLGQVDSVPYIKADNGRLIFEFNLEKVDGQAEKSTLRMYLRGDAAALSEIAYGQTLVLTGHIWAPDPITNPGEFDFGAYLSKNGFNGYATAKIEDVAIVATRQNAFSTLIDIRSSIARRIETLFPENNAIMQALVLADRSLISNDIRDSFQKTGITHLICISGMHVSVLAMAMQFFLKRMMNRKYAIGITLIALMLYGILIGFTASFVRAVIMFMIFSGAPIAGYPSDGITRLSAAMLLTLMVAPRQIYNAGFVLSYSATAGLILLDAPLNHLLHLDCALGRRPDAHPGIQLLRNMVLYFPKLLCATLSAQLATLPAVIAFFGVQSLISVPVNLLCVPLCMLAYPIGMLALLFCWISMPLATAIAAIPEFLLTVLSKIALTSAKLPFTGIRIGQYPVLLILLHGCIILAASNLSKISLGIRRFLPLSLIILAALATLNTYGQSLGFSIAFLDADQADCALIQTEGHNYLVDTGDTYSPIGDYLSAHVLHLDAVFLSHPDQDHAGGLMEVLTTMKPEKIYIPSGWNRVKTIGQSVLSAMALAESMDIEIIELAAGDCLTLSRNTTAQVFNPERNDSSHSANALSMLLSIDHKGHSALFTGDLPRDREPEALPDVDVLKVAHHGSDASTSDGFLDAITPQIAIISVGENSFGHPSEAILNALETRNVAIWRTDISGAITLRLKHNGQWQIKTYLPTGGHP